MNSDLPIVLYAEDSDDDAFLMQRAFKKLKFPGTLVIVRDGLEARQYLEGTDKFVDRTAHPLPKLVLLDINMPHISGLGVLKWVRAQAGLKALPTFMFTSSSQPSDLAEASASGATGYLVKPTNLNDFGELVEDLAAVCAYQIGNGPSPVVRGNVTKIS